MAYPFSAGSETFPTTVLLFISSPFQINIDNGFMGCQDVDVVYAHLSLLLTDYLLTEFFHQAVLPKAKHTWQEMS